MSPENELHSNHAHRPLDFRFVIKIERLSTGRGKAPHTYRYLVPTPALAVSFRPDCRYVVHDPSTGEIGTATIRAVRAANTFEVQTVATSTLSQGTFFINFPRVFVDEAFVVNSPAFQILAQTPEWSYDRPWDFIHLSHNGFQDGEHLKYLPILIDAQSYGTKQGIAADTYWVAWAAQQIFFNAYLEAEYVDSNMTIRCRVTGFRAVEADWIDLVALVHPDDVSFTTTEFIFLSTPTSHVVIDDHIRTLFVTYADSLPQVLNSVAPRRPCPLT